MLEKQRTQFKMIRKEFGKRWELTKPLLVYFVEPFEWWHLIYLFIGLTATVLTILEMLTWIN